MKTIEINANSTEDVVRQMQHYLGGGITERYGEYELKFDNEIGKGSIKCLTFDWGLSVMEFDAFFFDDLLFVTDNEDFNPIHFSYCSQGQFSHRFGDEEDYHVVEQYHSSIIVGEKGLKQYCIFPKDMDIHINKICVLRGELLKKSLNNIEHLNEILFKVFMDVKGKESFAYYAMHLRMADHIKAIRRTEIEGMGRILEIEGEVCKLLSMHISRHDFYGKSNLIPTCLLNNDLKIVKQLSKMIVDGPSEDYSLDRLSSKSGLSQIKLQEGFKFLYARTVTEYIRHIRLEAARELMTDSDLNISQIVYSIGFTSRSYFSKIFKEKYVLSPNEYKRQIPNMMVNAM